MVTSYIMAVAVSHLFPGKPCVSHPAHHKFGTEGSKILAKLVCQAEGIKEVYPIIPAFITSTDDTVVYVTDIEQENDAASIRFALRDSVVNFRNMKSKNYFVTSKKTNKLGIRIQLSCTFAANGNTAPIYVIIGGLKESDMPSSVYPNGYYVHCLEGLSAAAAIDPSVKTVGYIVFVCSGKNVSAINTNEEDEQMDIVDHNRNEVDEDSNEVADEVVESEGEDDDDEDGIDLGTGMRNNVTFYAKNVLLKFIQSQRENCSYNNEESDNDDKSSKAWFDGDINQVKVFSSPEFMSTAELLDIDMNKQNAARSASEQGADMGEMFKNYKSITQRRRLLDLPHSHIYSKVKALFDNLSKQHHIKIVSRKRRLLISFIADLPQIQLISCPRRAVITSFIRNGMLDEDDNLWPDINRMIGTLGYPLTDKQFHLIFNNFQVLYKSMRDCGYISEEVFNQVGFPLDTNSKGEVVHRDYGISQEWCQRAKIMSSPYQRQLRLQRFQSIRDALEKKERETREKILNKLEINSSAEMKIICKMKVIQETQNKRQRTTMNNEDGSVLNVVGSENVSLELSDNSSTVEEESNGDEEIDSVGKCKIESFDAPLSSELKVFIHVRKYSTLRASNNSRTGWKWPNKKTVEAAVKGEQCLILLAYELCDHPILLKVE